MPADKIQLRKGGITFPVGNSTVHVDGCKVEKAKTDKEIGVDLTFLDTVITVA